MVEPHSGTGGRPHAAPHRFFSLWGGLPDFCALVPVVWCLSYGITMSVVGSRIGRQSSTFALGIFLPVIGAPFLAAVGLVLGRLAKYLLGSRGPARLTRIAKWCAPIVLLATGIAASRHASEPLYAAERESRPRVIVNAAQITRRIADVTAGSATRAVRAYDRLAKVNQAIPWGSGSARLAYHDEILEVSFLPAGRSLQIPLPGISYVTVVDAMPLKMGPGAHPVLALLITGRATGRRDLIALVSEAGELAYLELLDRFWNFRSVPLAIMLSPAGDLVLVGSEPQHLLVFAPQAEAP